MNPRPYQTDCVEATDTVFTEVDRVLNVLPTGAGKTIIFSFQAQKRLARGERVLILAHREELIDQAIAKLKAATGIVAEKEKAEWHASLDAKVVVASMQSMIRRLDKWPSDHFGLVVCDEAHHVLADSWQSVVGHFHAHAQVLGVTATPDRGDKRNLGKYFDRIAFEIGLYSTGDSPGLIEQGYLSPITVKSIPLKIDLGAALPAIWEKDTDLDSDTYGQLIEVRRDKGVRQSNGDFKVQDLDSALDPYLGEIAAAIRDHAAFRRTLAFLPLIATSQKFVAACKDVGLAACHIDGESPDRKELLQRFAAGEFDVLSNAMLLTEGYDDPGIDCVVCLRPTRSRPLYAQMCGRGTRVAPGKENLLLLDFLWFHEKHELVKPANLIARNDEEAKEITKTIEASAMLPADVAELLPMDLQAAFCDVEAQREEKLRNELNEQSIREARELSPQQFAQLQGSVELASYEPVMAGDSEPVTPKQTHWLKKVRVDAKSGKVFLRAAPAGCKPLDLKRVENLGQASQILKLAFDKRNQGIRAASFSQREKMKRLGYHNWQYATFDEAGRFFAQLNRPREAQLI